MEKKALRPIRRVMLIFPPMFDVKMVDTNFCPPMGIAYLAAFIRDTVEVKLLDCLVEGHNRRVPVTEYMELVGLSYDDILDRIREYEPDMVGMSCLFSNQFASIKELARRIKKEIDPGIVLAAGGTHPSFLPERTLAGTDLDYIVLGEGELTLRDLIEAHNRGQGIEDLDGLAYRDNGNIVVHPRSRLVEDLDSLPFPARDLLPMEKYFQVNVPMALHWRKRRNTPIVTSRGCPYHCTFCSSTVHWGGRYRFRSPENVLREIQHLRDVYNIQELKFQDDNLTLSKSRAMAIFQGMVDRGLAMPWNTPNGVAVWTIDEEMVKAMKASGCFAITMAIESGDPWVLKNIIKKPLDLNKAVELRKLTQKYGITTSAYFIIGFPGETMEQIKSTLEFARSLKLEYFIPFVFNPLPGSELWNVCKEKGYIPEDYNYENANNYFNSDINTDQFNADELSRLQSQAYFRNMIKLPFRNPREFLNYYGKLAITRPSFLRTFLIHVISRV